MQNRHTGVQPERGRKEMDRQISAPFSGPQSFRDMRKHWAAWQAFKLDCGPENLSQGAA